MTFNPNIPAAGDQPAQSQSQMLTNFGQLNVIFDQDHVTFDAAASGDRGKHEKSTYVTQASDPTTLVNELVLYAKTVSGQTNLYARRESNGTVIQLTFGNPVASSSGSTFLAGGVILKWGTVSILNGASSAVVTFGTAFPNNLWLVVPGVQTSTNITSLTPSYESPSSAGFTMYRTGTSGNTTYSYVAIGN
jgi:hypothetical protein